MRDVIVGGAGWAVGADAFIIGCVLFFCNKMTLLKKYLDGPTRDTIALMTLLPPLARVV